MLITKAKPKHSIGIKRLLSQSDKMSFSPEMLNDTDICLVAVDGTQVVGFTYVGIYMGGKSAVIDSLAVDPSYSGQGIVPKLWERLIKIAKQKGVKLIYTFSQLDQYFPKVAANSQKLGFQTDGNHYAFIFGNMETLNGCR